MTQKQKNYFIFFVGLTSTFPIRVLGLLYPVEIIALLSFPFISKNGLWSNQRMKKVIGMAVLWFVGALIADFYNKTAFVDCLKGWFTILFFVSLIPFVYWALADNPKRWLWYVAGTGISSVLSFYLVKANDMNEMAFEVWQVYAWGGLCKTIAAVLYYKGKHKFAFLVYMFWAVYTLFNGSRNTFLCISMAVIILYYIDGLKVSNMGDKVFVFQKKLIPMFFILICGALVVDKVYENMASQGVLGERAYEKYWQQKMASGSILQSGRSTTFMGLELALRNPLIGYGSFARDKNNSFRYEYASTHNMDIAIDDKEDSLLPTHSHIVGFWVYHGIFGGLFWIYIIGLMFKVLKTGAFFSEPKMIGLFMVSFVSILWDIVFSPLGQRAPIVFFIVYLVVTESYYLKGRYLQRLSH